MKKIFIALLVLASATFAHATNYTATDQLYGWSSTTGQFWQTWTDHKTQLESELNFISQLVDDTSPVLGGNLTIGAFTIEGVNAVEFGFLDGVTSDIQTQLNTKYDSGDNVTLGTISAGGGGFIVDTDGDATARSFNVTPTTSGPQFSLWYEDSDNGSDYVGIGSPATNGNPLILLLPTTDPTSGQVLTFAAPTPVTFSDGVARDAAQGSWSSAGSGTTVEVAAGTSTLGTSEIADGACATVVTTAASGVTTADVISWGFNGDPTSTTGYNPATGVLTIFAYPSANNVNFKVCNISGAAITPGAITLNWRVDR